MVLWIKINTENRFSKRCIGCDKDRKGFNQDVFETLIKTLVTFSSKLSRCYWLLYISMCLVFKRMNLS